MRKSLNGLLLRHMLEFVHRYLKRLVVLRISNSCSFSPSSHKRNVCCNWRISSEVYDFMDENLLERPLENWKVQWRKHTQTNTVKCQGTMWSYPILASNHPTWLVSLSKIYYLVEWGFCTFWPPIFPQHLISILYENFIIYYMVFTGGQIWLAA